MTEHNKPWLLALILFGIGVSVVGIVWAVFDAILF